MNYYEIFKDGLKIIISCDIFQFNQKMINYLNNYFVINNYIGDTNYDELVIINMIKYDSLKDLKESYFIMYPHTYILSDKKNIINFIYDKFDDSQCLNLKRIIIDIFAKYYENLGVYFVHASAVVSKDSGKATVFIGDSCSGKTTNILFYLLSGEYDYMGNDRIGLRYCNGKLVAIGFPSNIGVRLSTLELSTELRNKILPYIDQTDYYKYMESSKRMRKINLNIYDLLNAFKCQSIAQCELSEFIITSYDDSNIDDFFSVVSGDILLNEIKKQSIPAISKEQYFLNDILQFNGTKIDFNIFNLNVMTFKSNLHPNSNKTLIKKYV